jgi:putative transcriptional regulator
MNDLKVKHRQAERDLGQELLDAVREIKSGGGRRFTIEIPPAVEARRKSGLSQTEFAKLLGVSKRTLQEWEQGRRQPSGAAKALLKIAVERPDVLREVLN